MDSNTLWSLRLGFTSAQAAQIKEAGIKKFLESSFSTGYDDSLPSFIAAGPLTVQQAKEYDKNYRSLTEEQRQQQHEESVKQLLLLKAWWVEKMMEPYPLREKMVLMLHNHFVVNARKVKVHYWVYQHNSLLRRHAFGNLRELARQMLKSNAMLVYLDNETNRKGKINENLSRELLELFTLGIGNYAEQDIVQGARGLAALTPGDEGGIYDNRFADNTPITYLGKKGVFKADDMVDIIFEQQPAPYLFTRKVLQWFIYDDPPEGLVKYYGDYFRKQDFEIKPLLLKIFSEEFGKPTAGAKIKDPLVYIMQLAEETGLKKPNPILVYNFIRSQGMDLYGQPNVKGWPGGNSWITSQTYLRRNKVADNLCKGFNLPVKPLAAYPDYFKEYVNEAAFRPAVTWSSRQTGNSEIITQLENRLLFDTDKALQENFEKILKYDFDPKSPNADEAVLRLFNYMVKTPEFQLI